MRRYLIYIFFLIPLLSSCISDDCSECADMAYDTKVKLEITWPNNLSSTKSAESPELDINDFTLFVFNQDGSLNTTKKVINPIFTTSRPYTSSVTMNLNSTSTAKYIYAIANCNDLLNSTATSSIATTINNNLTGLKNLFDNGLSVNYNDIIENGCLVHSGYTDAITQSGTNPYNYVASINLKPIVSKFDIIVNTMPAAPSDYNACIESISAFVLNTRNKSKLFSPNTSLTFPYIHGEYESFWDTYYQHNFNFQNINNQSNSLKGAITLNNTTPLSLYVPENDTISTLGSRHKTLVVLKVWYKLKGLDATEERFCRFLTVPLYPPTSGSALDNSTLSNRRGTRYTITFNLSGKYFGALSPLSSMMHPYSPLPTKTTKNLIYVEPEDYSKIEKIEWK